MDSSIVVQSTMFGESEVASFQPYKGYRFNLPKEKSYCKGCEEMKDVDEFSKNKVSSNGLHWYCKTCANQKDEPYKQHRIETGWQRRYGISLDEYQALFDKQGGVCAICGKPETRMHKGVVARLSVDHDHKTGKVRGLLCQPCNHGLGGFKDNLDLLSNAIDYLIDE